MTRPGIEPKSPGPLANTLTARPIKFNNSILTEINQLSYGKYTKQNTASDLVLCVSVLS